MSKIKVLESSIYNKISAGEVVERPASAVKELVENSIDAGATSIKVEISGGGLRMIKVTDNGSGIAADDIRTAFLPHATSKIRTEDDLYNIATLGFRGEALPSIASVSMMSLKSRPESEANGNYIELKAGAVTAEGPCALNQGSSVTVENLFFNTPARLKFMKKPKSEESAVESMLAGIALANPYVAIEFTADGNRLFSSPGKGLEQAVAAVYDPLIVKNLIPVNYIRGAYKVTGFTGNSTLSKSSRSYQTVVLNGRVINCQTVSLAAQKAYGSAMMTRCYPVFILDIVMPFNEVDVNVHPSKAEVRFRDSNLIFGIVHAAITLALNGNPVMQEVAADYTQADMPQSQAIPAEETRAPIKAHLNEVNLPQTPPGGSNYSNINKGRTGYDKSRLIGLIAESNDRARTISEKEGISAEILNNILMNSKLKEHDAGETEKAPNPEYRIIGQIFNTYIMLEFNGDALLIDQHAALERINYDKLMKDMEDGDFIQPLLVPYILQANRYESGVIGENINAFAAIGIEIEPFGNNSYRVSAVPAAINNINLEDFFKSSLSELMNGGALKLKDALKDRLAGIACKASIKGGDRLSNEQIAYLIKNLPDGKIPLQCPHGRPAVIRLTKTEIDKWFKRIV